MSLQRAKEKLELLIIRMQTFCLDPKWENFLEINEHTRLKNEQGHVFDHWKYACLSKYGQCWAHWNDHPLLQNLEAADAKAQDMGRRLQTRLKVQPRPVLLDRMWYMFFATGDISCLREAYAVGGSSNHELAINAVEMYQKFRNFYEEKIAQALEHNSDWFTTHDVCAAADELEIENPIEHVPTVFEDLSKEIDNAMQRLRDAEELGDDISPEMQKVLENDAETDKEHMDFLKQFMKVDTQVGIEQIAEIDRNTPRVDSEGRPLPDGFVEYTKQREKKEMDRVGKLFDKIASQLTL